MHICMVSGGLQPILPNRRGAIEPYIYGLSKNLAITNEVDVFGVGEGELVVGNLRIHTMPSVERIQKKLFTVLDWRIAAFAPFNAFVLKNVIALHRKNPIDILHIHEVYTGFAATISKLSLGIPSVFSVHNELRKTTPVLACDKFLPVSRYLETFLITQHKIRKEKIDLLNVAVNAKPPVGITIEQAKLALGLQNHKIVLFVGRKCPEKGPLVLLKAMYSVIKKYPDALCIFIGPDYYFGSTSSSYTKYLQEKINSLGLASQCVLKGFVSDEELTLYYLAADVFVCPSVWNEPFGLVLLEALSYGKPVIATRVGGIPEIVIDGQTGLLVESRNYLELANSIIMLLTNPDLARDLGKVGKNYVEEHFSFKVVGNRCLDIYEKVLSI